MDVYIVLSKLSGEEFEIDGVYSNNKNALIYAKKVLERMIEESYNPEKYNFNEEYQCLEKYNETFLDDLGEIKIIKEEVLTSESIRETIFSCEEYRIDKDINDGALFAYDKEGIFITCINAYINPKHFKLIVEDILKNGY